MQKVPQTVIQLDCTDNAVESEPYRCYVGAPFLFENDGYGPLDFASQTRLDEALETNAPGPVDAHVKANLDGAPPTVLKVKFNIFLVIQQRTAALARDASLTEPLQVRVNFGDDPLISPTTYFVTRPKLRADLNDEWINFSDSFFDIAKTVSVGRSSTPNYLQREVVGTNFSDIEAQKTRRNTLDKILPQTLSLNLSAFPSFFEIDHVVYFRRALIEQWSELGSLGLEKTATECSCTLSKQ